MKINNIFFVLVLICFLSVSYNSFSQIGLGLFAGPSIPNEYINDFYNNNTINIGDTNNTIGSFFRESSRIGYHFGGKLRMNLTKNFVVNAGVTWHSFPATNIEIKANDTILAQYTNRDNVIPVSAGFNFYLIRSVLGVYLTGDLTYNFITHTLNVVQQTAEEIPLSLSPSDSRVGVGFGAGIDWDFNSLILNFDARYSIANLIGKSENEQSKSFLSFSVGVYFGSSFKEKKTFDEQ